MSGCLARAAATLAALALFLAPGAQAGEDAAPSAAQVMVRGRTTLADALEAAIGPAPGGASGPSAAAGRRMDVLFVLDVTPYTAAQEKELAAAFTQLDERYPDARWRIGALGKRARGPFSQAASLVPVLEALLAEDTDAIATLPALSRSLKRGTPRGTRVVYLADWHFEDDAGLEKLLGVLVKRRVHVSVVGGEAGFGRAWNDGFFPPNRGRSDGRGGRILYAAEVGRSPFGGEDPRAPWHGGDTAWPHLPYLLGCTPWSTKFPVELAPPPPRREKVEKERYAREKEEHASDRKGRKAKPEDLQDRRKEEHVAGTRERYWFPLPSGWGPYPLMRLAGVTGGRYVLWSWNPSGRSDVEYDYSRCNTFAPDLRDRETIHAEIAERPLARALVRAWHEITTKEADIARMSPPLAEDARQPLEMRETRGHGLPFSWDTKREYDQFMALAPRHLAALQRAITLLHGALREPRKDAVDARYEADALLLLHTLEVKRFQLGEAIAAAKTLDVKTAWDRLPLHPRLDPEHYVVRRRDVEATTGIELHDEEAGAEILAKRKAFQERFEKTPFGEQVRRNGIVTYRLEWVGYAEGRPAKESPGESGGKRPHTAPPSGGSRPATGR